MKKNSKLHLGKVGKATIPNKSNPCEIAAYLVGSQGTTDIDDPFINGLQDLVTFRASDLPWCALRNVLSFGNEKDNKWKLNYYASVGSALHSWMQAELGRRGLIWGYWRCKNPECKRFIHLHESPRDRIEGKSRLQFYKSKPLWRGTNHRCPDCKKIGEYVEVALVRNKRLAFIDAFVKGGKKYQVGDFKRTNDEQQRFAKEYQLPQLAYYWYEIVVKGKVNKMSKDMLTGIALWYTPVKFDTPAKVEDIVKFPVFSYDNDQTMEIVKEAVLPSFKQRKLMIAVVNKNKTVGKLTDFRFCGDNEKLSKKYCFFCNFRKLCFDKFFGPGVSKEPLTSTLNTQVELIRKEIKKNKKKDRHHIAVFNS